MKNTISLVILIALIHPSFCQTEQNLKKHIKHLTSVEFKGRVVGSTGGRNAAAYISKQFKINNVQPYNNESYYQHFYIYKDSGAKSTIYLNNVQIPFSCYGKEIKHDDSINFKIKPLLDRNYKSLNNNCTLLYPKDLNEGIRNVKKLNEDFGTKQFLLAFKPRSRSIKIHTNIRVPLESKNFFEIFHYGNLFHGIKDYGTKYYLTKRPTDKNGFNEDSFCDYDIYIASTSNIDTILNKGNDATNSISISKKRVLTDSVKVQNVIAKIEGKNPKKGAIVLCAHYDHVAPLPHQHKLHNNIADSLLYIPGADDNASGTAGVIEIASLLAKSEVKPEQTIYFCLFDGEEAGFFGSTIFNKHFNDSISLVINFDMIGRNKYDWNINKNKVFAKAEGVNANSVLNSFNKQVRKNKNLSIDKRMIKDGWKNASDHVVFRKRTDIMYFFTGDHKDYHTPNDTEDKINYTKLNAFCTEFAELLLNIKL